MLLMQYTVGEGGRLFVEQVAPVSYILWERILPFFPSQFVGNISYFTAEFFQKLASKMFF